MKDPFKILKYPIVTEKTILMIDRDNKITFAVDRKASKKEIKEAFEKLFEVKVEKVNTLIDMKRGIKKAYIKLKKEFSARDVATKLGIV
ncbi:MAG: 50S ribosomal protein L23 [Candidatus Aenigmarchaeota archaeon ex4484_224]|nr:MAG: 50S ribosomal protein L23 [Candidatus Aenigmarchaeota archaeon ex4484_224]